MPFALWHLLTLASNGDRSAMQDQSIYGWRGSDSSIVQRFMRDYKLAKPYTLELNFRCTNTISLAAQHLITSGADAERVHKEMRSARGQTGSEKEAKIKIYRAFDERDEGEFVGKEIQRLVQAGIEGSYSDVGVVVRAKDQGRVVEKFLSKLGVPVKLVMGGVGLWERREVRDVVAYLRVIANPRDSSSLRR